MREISLDILEKVLARIENIVLRVEHHYWNVHDKSKIDLVVEFYLLRRDGKGDVFYDDKLELLPNYDRHSTMQFIYNNNAHNHFYLMTEKELERIYTLKEME